jgi:hypothetical protein
MMSRAPATTQAELIAAVATLTSEVAALKEIVTQLNTDLKAVTEFKNKSVYVATGVALAFSAIGAMLTKAWGFLFPPA